MINGIIVVVFLIVIHRDNAVRGHRTVSNNSRVEDTSGGQHIKQKNRSLVLMYGRQVCAAIHVTRSNMQTG